MFPLTVKQRIEIIKIKLNEIEIEVDYSAKDKEQLRRFYHRQIKALDPKAKC